MRLLELVREDVNRLATKIEAPDHLLPTYGESEDFARPHVEEVDDGLMAWVVVERGKELERRSTYDRKELLYWIFEAVTFSMASDYEASHRNDDEDEDPRRLLFSRQLELLHTLEPRWATRKAQELGSLLDEVGLS